MSNTATSSNETAAAAPAVDGVLDAAAARFATEKTPAPADATQTAATDKAAADKAAADKVVADKAVADKATADKATADKVVADKAEADRIAAMTPEQKVEHDKKIAADAEGAKPADVSAVKLPDGIKQDPTTMAEFAEFAKTNNLTQAQAQQVAELGAKMMQRNLDTQVENIKAAGIEWSKQSTADKEFGGEKLGENLSVAKRAVDKFASADLKKLLGNYDPKDNPMGTGLGNHPEFIRAFFNIGKTISEDSVVTGGSGKTTASSNPADVLYGKTK